MQIMPGGILAARHTLMEGRAINDYRIEFL